MMMTESPFNSQKRRHTAIPLRPSYGLSYDDDTDRFHFFRMLSRNMSHADEDMNLSSTASPVREISPEIQFL